MKFLSRFHIHRVENDMIVKPLLSRAKCVCLQNLNKNLCVPYNKSYADTFPQSVQKNFHFLLQTYLKIIPKYDIISLQFNSRRKSNTKPDNNVRRKLLLPSCSRREARNLYGNY